MDHFKEITFTSKYNIVFLYENISKEALAIKIDSLVTNEGYKMEQGNIGDGTYYKGDKTMRMLFGAFVKYSKFRFVTATKDSVYCTVDMRDATPELSGGYIGMKQVKKEMLHLSILLQKV